MLEAAPALSGRLFFVITCAIGGLSLTTVTITRIPRGYLTSYFDWVLLGLYQLAEQKQLQLKFRLPADMNLLRLSSNEKLNHTLSSLQDKIAPDGDFCLRGKAELDSGEVKTFCIDCSDSPFLYNEKDLQTVDRYFKIQCPKEFGPAFRLTDGVEIPWQDVTFVEDEAVSARRVIADFHRYTDKIRPLMLGPRRLAYGIGYAGLKASFEHYLTSYKAVKSKKVMCYFGDSKGPVPAKDVKKVDYSSESQLVGFLGDCIHHPNEKRAIAADLINQTPGGDGRVINQGNSDLDNVSSKHLVVPLAQFCDFIADFQYNVNISGYRLSIPSRFIESFMGGTAILTDKLSVRWFRPFGSEVTETVEMGYLPMDKVDWDGFRADLSSLPQTNPAEIRRAFEEKWAPNRVAAYILESMSD